MKTIFKYIICLFSLSIILSCEDSIETVSSFPFEANIIGTKNVLLNETLTNELIITSENLVENTNFSFSYNSNGKGYYEVDDNRLNEDEIYDLPSDILSKEIVYIPLEDGEHNVFFNISNNKEHTASTQTTYLISKEVTDFEFNFSLTDDTLFVQDETNINFSIEQTTDEDIFYSVTIDSNSNGNIDWNDLNGLDLLPANNNLRQGNYVFDYTPTEITDLNNFTVTVTSSNGISKTEVFNGLEVTSVPFDFSLSKTVVNIGENQFNEFISITLDRPSFSTGYFYESQYYLRVSTTTDGILFDNGRISYGENIVLDDYTGVSNETFSYSLIFADNKEEIVPGEMTFTVFNDTGFEASKTISLIIE